jgi:hypothetical protein
MKQKLPTLAAIGGLVCLSVVLCPGCSHLYFMAADLGMTVCAITALLHGGKPLRRLAWVALFFGLLGLFISRPIDASGSISLNKPNPTPPAGMPGWIQWGSAVGGNNHYYALTSYATNWVAAQNLAVSWGGHLVVITSAEEQNFINQTFLTGKCEHLPVWIGLVRTSTNVTSTSTNSTMPLAVRLRRAAADLGLHVGAPQNTEFTWVTREVCSYSNWHPNQPDNFPPGESYAAMNWHYSDNPARGIKGDWNDAPVNGTTGFGGKTDGPYFGLVEIAWPPQPLLTPSRWALVTLAALSLAAALALISKK